MPTLSPFDLLVLGPVVGLLATLAMDLAIRRLPEGRTPPLVAASVLADTRVDDAPVRLAKWVHYVAGALSGVLFVVVTAAAGSVIPGPSLVALGVGAVVMFGLMVGFFVLVPLPRARGLPRQRVRQASRDWAIMAATYLVAATALIALLGAA